MSHSVFLNSNPNFANSSGDHFTATFADTIEIPAGSAVGAYQVSLTKKPISLYGNVDVLLTCSDENNLFYDALRNDIGTDADEIDPQSSLAEVNLNIPIAQGNYTKREFLSHIQDQINQEISLNNLDGGTPLFNYKCVVRDTEERMFLGLIPDFPMSHAFPTNNDTNRLNACIPTAEGLATEIVQPTATSDGSNILCWWSCQSAVYPLQRAQAGNTLGETNNKFNFSPVFTYSGEDHRSDGYNRFAVSFCTQENWDDIGATTGTVTLTNAINISDAFPDVPLTVTIDADYNNRQGIISVVHKADSASAPTVVSACHFDNGVEGMNLQVEFYQGDFGNGKTSTIDGDKKVDGKFYFLVRTLAPLAEAPGGVGFKTGDVLYDSRLEGITLPEDLVAKCFRLDSGTAPANWDGLVPRIWFNNLDINTVDGPVLDDFGMKVEGNFIVFRPSERLRNVVGCMDYTFNADVDPTDTENTLPQILGSAQAILSPNGYNPQENNKFGYTELFGNTQNYNIEISVPVKAQTNTTTTSDLGVERPIVFGLNSVFAGKLREVESSRLHRSVYPPVLKQLALKNPTDIRTNSIEVRVKRANSNKQASEITECQLELLIN